MNEAISDIEGAIQLLRTVVESQRNRCFLFSAETGDDIAGRARRRDAGSHERLLRFAIREPVDDATIWHAADVVEADVARARRSEAAAERRADWCRRRPSVPSFRFVCRSMSMLCNIVQLGFAFSYVVPAIVERWQNRQLGKKKEHRVFFFF